MPEYTNAQVALIQAVECYRANPTGIKTTSDITEIASNFLTWLNQRS